MDAQKGILLLLLGHIAALVLDAACCHTCNAVYRSALLTLKAVLQSRARLGLELGLSLG